MRHSLFHWGQSGTTEVELSEPEFNRATVATHGILEALSIEEKFDLVLGNFEEYERDILGDALHRTLFSRDDWSDNMSHLHHLNRRVVNLLSTCRLYVDQVSHNISSLYGSDSEQLKQLKSRCAEEYNGHLGYRAMEALRNYAQHCNLPVYAIHHDSTKIGAASGDGYELCVGLMLSTAALRADGSFKASILVELESIGDRVDITPLMRAYIAGLGRLHYTVRDMLLSDLASWEAELDALRLRFAEAGGKDTDHLSLATVSADGFHETSTQFFREQGQRRKWLENKNRNLTNTERTRIVSSRIPEA